jgi:hypothetical protein
VVKKEIKKNTNATPINPTVLMLAIPIRAKRDLM